MLKFNTICEFKENVIKTQQAPDTIEIDGKEYTMSFYDEKGVVIVYLYEDEDNQDNNIVLELVTENRYSSYGFNDLYIVEVST
jgi:hypothetical protein